MNPPQSFRYGIARKIGQVPPPESRFVFGGYQPSLPSCSTIFAFYIAEDVPKFNSDTSELSDTTVRELALEEKFLTKYRKKKKESHTFSSAARDSKTFKASTGCSTVKAGTPSYEKKNIRMRRQEKDKIHLEDSSLLPCNISYSLSEYMDMINSQRGNAGDDWLWNNVCTVVRTTNPHFKDSRIDFTFPKDVKSHECNESEVAWHLRCSWNLTLSKVSQVGHHG